MPPDPRDPPRPPPPRRVAILGAGPVGLEAALYARGLGFDVAVFDRGDVAASVAGWGFVTLFSPWRMNTTALGRAVVPEGPAFAGPLADVCPSGRELRDRYLLPLAGSPAVRGAVRPYTEVVAVARQDYGKADEIGTGRRRGSRFRVLVRDARTRAERVETADVVLDCTGTYGHHRWAGRGGVPAPGERRAREHVLYTIPDLLGTDRPRYADRHTLLLGCGYSAATALTAFERLHRSHPRTRVSWAFRRPGQALRAIAGDPLPARRGLVEASLALADRPPPWLQFLGHATLEAVDGGTPLGVTLDHAGTAVSLAVDEVVALVGYGPDASIYDQLQVHQCYATAGPMKLAAALLGEAGADCLTAGAALGPEALRNPEPDFLILGAKSYGTNSNFLLQTGHAQVRDAFRLITGDAALDLYACVPAAVTTR